jgi:hypothetical protein
MDERRAIANHVKRMLFLLANVKRFKFRAIEIRLPLSGLSQDRASVTMATTISVQTKRPADTVSLFENTDFKESQKKPSV